MRLTQYIRETRAEEDFELSEDVKELHKLLPKIKSSCKPWLNKIKSTPYGLFRGMKDIRRIVKKTVRLDRMPVDTSAVEQEEIDKAFYDAFGWKPRAGGVFTTPDPGRSQAYGTLCMVLPIGPVKHLWSPSVFDLYFKLGQMRPHWTELPGTERESGEASPEYNIKYAPKEQIFKEVIKSYTEGQLKAAFETRTEIMLNCKAYYAIPGLTCYYWLNQMGHWKSERETIRYEKEMYKKFIEEALL